MTQRGASASVLTEMAKAANMPVNLYAADFESGSVYFNDSPRDITWGGNLYVSSGKVIQHSEIEDNIDFQITGTNIVVSGVPIDIMTLFINTSLIGRKIRIYQGFLDSNLALIADPFLKFQGSMDGGALEEDPTSGTASITIPCVNVFADFEKTQGRKTNDNTQKAFFSDDRAFEFIPTLRDSIIKWGTV